jgi:ribosome biogenesis protein Nip4
MIKPLEDFLSRFNAKIFLDETFLVKKRNRYFLLNEALKNVIARNFFYAGLYLGKMRKGRFFPSFNLLKMIGKTKANKVVVDKKTEWLFICGRDIFKRGIKKVKGSREKGSYVLILNMKDECLGYGKILHNLNKTSERVVIKNILDIGDFLRRESK